MANTPVELFVIRRWLNPRYANLDEDLSWEAGPGDASFFYSLAEAMDALYQIDPYQVSDTEVIPVISDTDGVTAYV